MREGAGTALAPSDPACSPPSPSSKISPCRASPSRGRPWRARCHSASRLALRAPRSLCPDACSHRAISGPQTVAVGFKRIDVIERDERHVHAKPSSRHPSDPGSEPTSDLLFASNSIEQHRTRGRGERTPRGPCAEQRDPRRTLTHLITTKELFERAARDAGPRRPACPDQRRLRRRPPRGQAGTLADHPARIPPRAAPTGEPRGVPRGDEARVGRDVPRASPVAAGEANRAPGTERSPCPGQAQRREKSSAGQVEPPSTSGHLAPGPAQAMLRPRAPVAQQDRAPVS